MKTKYIVSLLLVGAFLPSMASASMMSNVFNLLFPERSIERSPDLEATRKHATAPLMTRGQEIYNSHMMNEGTSASDNKIESRSDKTPEDYIVTEPGLQPWEAMHYKNRIRKAYELTSEDEDASKKPVIEAKYKQVRYDRKYRSEKNTLDGQRSGRGKLYRQFFQ